ncbi:MAG: hypothetical protein JNL11_19335 [Bdellovibrionaceae bacterium]|nr:hypothetical protein [Pseudobdellovibrionaceae bacterium]
MKIFYFILILTCISKGEILFFDLNDNPKEIEAARRAAKKRNESLIVYPSISVTDKREIDKTKTEFHNARSVYRECLNTNIVGCAELKTKYQSARSIYDSTREKFKLNASKLNKIMESLKNSNTKISSVVISGHDGNGYFTGSNGDLNDRDLLVHLVKMLLLAMVSGRCCYGAVTRPISAVC